MTSTAPYPMNILEEVFPKLTPFLTTLAATSLVVLVSNSLHKTKKVLFQAFFFSVSLAGALTYLMFNGDASLSSTFDNFTKLSFETQFCIFSIVICCVYFGGAMYLASPDISEEDSSSASVSAVLQTPASCDSEIGFTVPDVVPEDDHEFFVAAFDKIVNDILENLPTTYELLPEAFEWVKENVAYNVAGGKMNRGLACAAVRKTLAKSYGRSLTTKERYQAAALGWCVEFLQAFFLVADDVMDDSKTRRGQPCWFRLERVKLIAINDSFILESFVYKILKKYFGGEVYYPQLVDLFIEVTRQTEFGQLLDLTSQPQDGEIDLNRFTMERYSSIVRYKTAFYSFYLPVALGMIVSGIQDPDLYSKARHILVIMGEYFQIQDDYLDCFGDPEVIGKIGTDIQDNKCSWLVVKALEMATPAQRKILEDNYGQSSDRKVAKVKKLYEEMDLAGVFHAYEEQSYQQIQSLLNEITTMPREVFEFLLRKIYKRSK